MDLLSSAEQELAEVERKLADLAQLAQRRDQLRMFINIGRTLYAAPAGQGSLVPQAEPAVHLADTPISYIGGESKKARIADAVATLLVAEGPMQTRALVARLEAQGVDIGGSNKIDTVSVVLSRTKDRFKSDRAAGGWTLVAPHKEATPPSAPTLAGS